MSWNDNRVAWLPEGQGAGRGARGSGHGFLGTTDLGDVSALRFQFFGNQKILEILFITLSSVVFYTWV